MTTSNTTDTGFGLLKTVGTFGRIGLRVATTRGDIGEALRHVTHQADGVVWFKPLNIAIIGHPDIRRILLDSDHTKGDVHQAIRGDLGPVLVSLDPGHPREEIRAALQLYLDASHVSNYTDIIQSVIDNRLQSRSTGQTLNIRDFCDHLTMGIMYRSLFANFVMNEAEREIFTEAIGATVLTSFARGVGGGSAARLVSLFNRAGSKRKALFQRLQELWDHYMTLPDNELVRDAFGQLVLAAKTGKMTDEEARTQAIIIIAAGHETTASALAWIIYELGRLTDYQAQLRQEVLDNTQPNVLDIQTLRQLPLLNHAIDEVLRLYSPAWIVVRQLGKDEVINDIHLPKGTNVWLVTTAAHRWQQYFAQPDDFLLTRDKSLYRKYTVPFGAGYGSCVGAPFARTEMQIVISHFLRTFQWSVAGSHRHLNPIYSTAIRIPKFANIELKL